MTKLVRLFITARSLRAPIWAALALFLVSPATAQDSHDVGGTPGGELFGEGLTAPGRELNQDDTDRNFAPVPPALPSVAPGELPAGKRKLGLAAQLSEDGPALTGGVIWRIYSAVPDKDGNLPLVQTEDAGATTVSLPAGDYLIHAAFGRAGATQRVALRADDRKEVLVLNAGGLKLDAVVGDGRHVDSDDLSFDVMQESDNGELVPVIPKAKPGPVLRLSSGTYHVVARYGTVNSEVKADIQVEAGKLTEAVMRLTGAGVTLKLVANDGGEALANTSWTVLNQDGTTVHESVGAFPSMILAEGTYTAVATHQNEIYSADFQVESGVDRDVEVKLTDIVKPEPAGSQPEISGAPMEP